MPKVDLYVTLVRDSSGELFLDLGANKVLELPPDRQEKYRLKWILRDAQLNGAKFVPDQKTPAFEWRPREGNGQFGPPTIESFGQHLRLVDDHAGAETAGFFEYQIGVRTSDNTYYVTKPEPLRLKGGKTVNSPIIINKIDGGGGPKARPTKATTKKKPAAAKQPAAKAATKKAAKKATKKTTKQPAKKLAKKAATKRVAVNKKAAKKSAGKRK